MSVTLLDSDAYHSEPASGDNGPPLLSQSVAHTLVSKSPRHAWLAHPRLGNRRRAATTEMDLGTVVHRLLLGKGRGFEVAHYREVPDVDPGEEPAKKGRSRKPPEPPPEGPDGVPEWKDWRRGDAQSVKAEIASRGLVALLPRELRDAQSLAATFREEIAKFGIVLDGANEFALSWNETASNGATVRCRGMLDHWHESTRTIYDIKVVRSAHPKAAKSHMYGFGGDIQSEAYTRAIEHWRPDLAGRVRFVFLFCEVSSGVVTPAYPTGTMRMLGNLRWRRAVDTWEKCLRTGHWPAYVEEPIGIDAPEWGLAAEISDAIEFSESVRYLPQDIPSGEADHEGEGHEREEENVC